MSDLEQRQRALESALGPADLTHIHAVVPFDFGLEVGGRPDVLTWSNFTELGTLYVTCELTGRDDQRPNRDGAYELAVVQAHPEQWAVDLVRKLAFYTLDTPLNDGETMDVGPAVPAASPIRALLFRRIATFEAFGRDASVLCCIGITGDELDYVLDDGADALWANLPGEYLLTTSHRKSFV